MTYGPCSSTWYTSATNSEGMYDTTALTEQVTTSTEYGTQTAYSYITCNLSYINQGINYDDYKRTTMSTTYNESGYVTSQYQYYKQSMPVAYGTFSYTAITKTSYQNGNSYSYSDSGTARNLYFFLTKSTQANNYTTVYANYTTDENGITGSYLGTRLFENDTSIRYYTYAYVTQNNNTIITTGTTYYTAESTTAYTGKSSSIESTSSSWYTSNEDGSGLYNTTALTVESTTGTSYETETINVNSSFEYKQYISSSTFIRYHAESQNYTKYYMTTINSATKITSINKSIGATFTNYSLIANSNSAISLYTSSYRTTNSNNSTSSSTSSITGRAVIIKFNSPFTFTLTTGSTTYKSGDGKYSGTGYYTSEQFATENDSYINILFNATVSTSACTQNGAVINWNIGSYFSRRELYINLLEGIQTLTTGTSYLTAEVTTGYSGVSSYSTINSGWS